MAEGKHREITQEDIDRMRARIGVLIPHNTPWNEVASEDAIRHHALGIGDPNPLFCDAKYARRTRWGSVLAAPFFIETMGTSRVKVIPPEVREKGRGALSGVHQFYAGNESEYFLPVQAGDRMTISHYVSDVEEKQSSLSGRSVHYKYRHVWANQRGQVVAIASRLVIAGGREKKSGERKKYADITPQYYTPEDIKRIEAVYGEEELRGAKPRWFEDVQVGDALPPVIKGPLTVTDVVAFNMGRGSPFIKGANRVGWEDRMKHPGGYVDNEYGIPDIAERVHWEEALAKKTGNPMPYDYGGQRCDWLGHLMTNWVGDDGFLRKIRVNMRMFNYVGDTTWCEGRITEKYEENGQFLVRCDIWCRDQRDRKTADGFAIAALPSRKYGDVILPIRTERDILGDMYENSLAMAAREAA